MVLFLLEPYSFHIEDTLPENTERLVDVELSFHTVGIRSFLLGLLLLHPHVPFLFFLLLQKIDSLIHA